MAKALLICSLLWLTVAGLVQCTVSFTVCPSQLQEANDSCLTLSQYAEHSSQYFIENSTFIFLPGEHILSVSVILDDVSNIVFSGGPDVTITCRGTAHIKGRNVTNVTFSHLNFESCGSRHVLSSNMAAFVFVDSQQIQMEYTSFRGSDRLFSRAIHSTFCDLEISYFTATSFDGGAVHITGGSVQFSGNNSFTDNIAENGSAIMARNSVVYFDGQNSFLSNKGRQVGDRSLCGGAVYSENTSMVFDGTTVFMNNALMGAGHGGALYSVGGTLVLLGNTQFRANIATSGGAVAVFSGSIRIEGECEFSGHNISGNGGALYVMNYGYGYIQGMVMFLNNSAVNGGSIYCDSAAVAFFGDVTFSNNTAAIAGGAIYIANGLVKLLRTSDISNNNGGVQGGAIYSHNSTIKIQGEQNLRSNFAPEGGVMSLISSRLQVGYPLQVRAVSNEAMYGAVLFVSEMFSLLQCARTFSMDITDHPQCFLQADHASDRNISFEIEDNSASVSGDLIYGGNLHICRFRSSMQGEFKINALEYLSSILTSKNLNLSENDISSLITSEPAQMCFCDSTGVSSCGMNITVTTQPGKLLNFSVVSVGQAMSPVPAIVRSYFESTAGFKSFAELDLQERVQLTTSSCNTLSYRIFSPNATETLVLYPDGPCRDTGNATISVNVNIETCPDGFQLEGSECRCDEFLRRYTNSCNIDDGTITRSGGFWFAGLYMCNGSLFFSRVIITPNNTEENCTLSYEGLLTQRQCPFDFCVTDPVNVTLTNPDIQCSQNRTGVLCGACVEGTSLLIGGFRCAKCTDNYIALIVLFAAAGIGLVFLIVILKMTVASGTLNGLIFYANIVSANRLSFLPNNPANPLTVFIAWLNLDFGIETCFYDGMDSYARTWLQFVFPLYLWLIMILIILISRYSSKAAKVFGSNPVAVLATIFLLSYSKILRTVIIALSLTNVYYEEFITRTVWLYDGNLAYFQGQHALLGVIAWLVLMFLFLPYTVFLLLLPWMQGFSDKRGFRWLNKVKPLADAYFAPYRKQTRYWTGCLLILRCILFLIFALNFLDLPSVNLISISSVVALLLTLPWMFGSLYENRYLNILEASSYFNLLVFSVGTYHVSAIGGSQAALAYTSIFFALMTFIGIVIYHAYIRVKNLKCFERKRRVDGILNKAFEDKDTTSVTTTDVSIPDVSEGYSYASTVGFRESLFEDNLVN